jgi:hypothetical protein
LRCAASFPSLARTCSAKQLTGSFKKRRDGDACNMSNKKSGTLWIRTKTGPWGAFDWKILREWFSLKWLPPETEIAEEKDGPWQQAQSFAKFWKETQAMAKRVEEFEIVDLESEKVPLSPALRNRIVELGWPGNVELLRNYYWGNKLREQLESFFPDQSRSPFDDPDWPKCWSWPSPAGALRQEQVRLKEPFTPAQSEVLMFFLGANHGVITKGDASDKIKELLDDPNNDARWEDHKSKIPATEKQRDRLKWWAEKLGRRLPSPLMKAQASQLIDQWLEEHPELESEWYEQKERREEFDMEISIVVDDVDDWREFYDCKKISEKKVRNVLEVIGSRTASEKLDQFMNRFFAELRRQEPTLFSGRQAVARARSSAKPKGSCLILCIALLLLFAGVVGALAAHLFSR